jgi:hypothetical protein
MHPAPTTDTVTLRHLRLQSGRTIYQIRDRMVAFDANAPKDPTNVIRMEKKGTSNVRTLIAFAHAVEQPLDVVLKANEASRLYGPLCSGRRGRRDKPVINLISNPITP